MRKSYFVCNVLLSIIFVFLSSGCTRSLDMSYTVGSDRISNDVAIRKVNVGVAKFHDKRAWVDNSDEKSESFVALQGPWKFGLTYKDKKYMPVKDILQDIIIQEFQAVGFNAMPINNIIENQDVTKIKQTGEQLNLDYLLNGEILVFEFVNETGFWTVTSRRAATINLSLIKPKTNEIIYNSVVNANDRENEGMGVMHSTNVDKLMNNVLKKVIQQINQILISQVVPKP